MGKEQWKGGNLIEMSAYDKVSAYTKARRYYIWQAFPVFLWNLFEVDDGHYCGSILRHPPYQFFKIILQKACCSVSPQGEEDCTIRLRIPLRDPIYHDR
jgi:hypothetical protein